MRELNLCTCGHTAEEHRGGKMGYHECEVDGCDCICFEEDGDEDDA